MLSAFRCFCLAALSLLNFYIFRNTSLRRCPTQGIQFRRPRAHPDNVESGGGERARNLFIIPKESIWTIV